MEVPVGPPLSPDSCEMEWGAVATSEHDRIADMAAF